MVDDKEFVPKTCDECIKSRYKLPKPNCSHEQGLDHKRSYEFFKNVYKVELPQHLEAMHILKDRRVECLEQIQQQVVKMVSLRRALDIDTMLTKISDLSTRVCDMEENGGPKKETSDDDRILASPQRKGETEAVTKKVIKHEVTPILKERQPAKKENNDAEPLPLKDRGWLMYVRNCKKDNLEDYANKLKQEHPDLSENQIKISLNAAGNYMIRYTLNPDLA
jgi:hypothetical protein